MLLETFPTGGKKKDKGWEVGLPQNLLWFVGKVKPEMWALSVRKNPIKSISIYWILSR